MDGVTKWQLQVDQDGKLKMETNLRSDVILVSRNSKRMGVIELTVPSEDRKKVSNEKKRSNYLVLQAEG